MTLEEHVWFRALALGLPNREVLIRDSLEHVSFRAFALGLPNREVLIRDCSPAATRSSWAATVGARDMQRRAEHNSTGRRVAGDIRTPTKKCPRWSHSLKI